MLEMLFLAGNKSANNMLIAAAKLQYNGDISGFTSLMRNPITIVGSVISIRLIKIFMLNEMFFVPRIVHASLWLSDLVFLFFIVDD